MECKFIKHGLAVSYDGTLKPCCAWSVDETWRSNNHYSAVNIVQWHKNTELLKISESLENNGWPKECHNCKVIEDNNRYDSMRGNGNHAYAHYTNDDITLEIRPGNTCNYACQTCWPDASSRVAQFQQQAGIINSIPANASIDNFDFLLPIAGRIRDVVLLGGEPFYDKSCKKFLAWANENLESNIILFTNGSMIDYNWLSSYPKKIILVFSIDAIGRPAEYIRFGTVWEEVYNNFLKVQQLPNVELRVNITMSAYNYIYINDVITLLCKKWPAVVSFGTPKPSYLLESAIPYTHRQPIIDLLEQSLDRISQTDIESGQKSNALAAITSIISNLQDNNFSEQDHRTLCDFISKMDKVKSISIAEYCPEVSDILLPTYK